MYFVLPKNRIVKFKVGLGKGSNNYDEFMALRLLFKCVTDKHVCQIDLSIDYSLFINWFKGSFHFLNICFTPINDQRKEVASYFKHISFTHIYRK